MHDVNKWIFLDTPINAILALRPLSMAFFEKSGIDPFTAPTGKIGDICKSKGIPWDAFIDEMSALEVPGRNSEWSALPPYFLLDHLTQEHREFIRDFLPAIKLALAEWDKHGEDRGRMQSLIRAWPAFARSLNEHIAAEESFLFQKILRYDYCSRHDKVDPDFFEGSVKVFAALQLHKNEEGLADVIRNFHTATSASLPASRDRDESESAIMGLLASFEAKHMDHSRIEQEMLVPMADALEKRLYDLRISGPAVPLTPLPPAAARIKRAHEMP